MGRRALFNLVGGAAVHETGAQTDEADCCPSLRAQTENAMSWIKEMTDYNVPKGKLNRGLAVLDGTGLSSWLIE